jgi:hypothetical protein
MGGENRVDGVKILLVTPHSLPFHGRVQQQKNQSRNGLRDNGSCGEVNHPASGSGGAHQQLPVRETHR